MNIVEENYNGYDNVNLVTLDNGKKYLLYVPDVVDSSTGIHVHGRGSGCGESDINGGHASKVIDILSDNESNSIVIIPMASYNNEEWEENAVAMISEVKEQYNISHDNLSYSGWSGGAFPALKTTVEYIKQNPDAPPQILFTLDDVSPTIYNAQNNTQSRDYVLNNGGREALAGNDTVIFMFQANTPGKTYNLKTKAAYDLTEAGANVIRVRIVSCGGHEGINDNFFKKNLEEYVVGNAELPNENYIYEKPVYNEETGEWSWEKVDVNDIKTRDQLYSYIGYNSSGVVNIPELPDFHNDFEFTYEIENIGEQYAYLDNLTKGKISYVVDPNNAESVLLSSNLEFVQNFANGLVDAIKVEEIESMTTIKSSAACGPLLSIIGGYISTYSNASAKLLNSLSQESAAIMSIGQLFADMDMDLRDDVLEDIEDSQGESMDSADSVVGGEIVDNEEEQMTETEEQENIDQDENSNEETTDEEQEDSLDEEIEEEQEENDETEEQETVTEEVTDENGDNEEVTQGENPLGTEEKNDSPPDKKDTPGHTGGTPNYENDLNLDSSEQVYEQDGYKVVFEMDDGNIEAMKYQYEYGSVEEATSYYQYLLSEYQGSEYIENIVLDGTNVEIIFKSSVLENMTTQELMEKYFIGRIDY